MQVGEARSKKELIQAVEALRVKRLESRRAFETQWWNNIALVAGDHYVEFDANAGTFMSPPKDPDKVRLVLNQARVVARTELAKVTKSRPIFDIVPNSMDEEDIAATKVGQFALSAAEWTFKLKRFRKRALWWTILTGCSAVYVGYNAGAMSGGFYEVVVDPNTKEPTWNPARIEELKQLADSGEIDLVPERWPLGDLEFKLYTPFQILPDDTVFEFDEMADVIVTDAIEVEQAKNMWPEAKDSLRGATPTDGILSRMMRRAGLTQASEQTTSQDTVQIHTYWLKPGVYPNNDFLKNGAMIRWSDRQVELEFHDGFPFNDARLPFAFFRHTPNATSIWPDTTITDIRGPNLELDKTISQLLENRDFMVNPMWLHANQSQVQTIKSQPGGVVKYTHVRDVPPPQQLPGVPMPAQVENLVIGLRDQILDLSGQGEVSRGRMPAGVRSGVQMSYLQEEDETKLGPVIEEFEDALSTMGSLILCRMGQFYMTSRLLKNYRSGAQADVRKFKGADLKGNTDVQVQSGSALPKLKAAKQQFALNMAELGIEQDPKRLRDMLELGEGEPDDVDLAFAQADRENEKMRGLVLESVENPKGDEKEGEGAQAVPVKEWHNHDAHIKRHTRVMMTAEFERMATTHPDIVRIFDEHISMHQQIKQKQMQEQIAMMQAASGGPAHTAPDSAEMPGAGAAEVQRRSAT